MSKTAIAIHAGVGNRESVIDHYMQEYKNGLEIAIKKAHNVLEKGGRAIDAVEIAVINLEDNPLFNAGRGSALNMMGEVEMDAAIMCGESLQAGAVSMVQNIKNPIRLASHIMNNCECVFLSGYGAHDLAKKLNLDMEPHAYFITEHQVDKFLVNRDKFSGQKVPYNKSHGTVGAVALDKHGNVASATSTGGASYCLPGRVGDSCIIGAGCYANNKTCAVSGTGDGEFLITGVVANSIALIKEFTNKQLVEACDEVIHRRITANCEMGVISLDAEGNIGISFNTKIMKRAWIDTQGTFNVKLFE